MGKYYNKPPTLERQLLSAKDNDELQQVVDVFNVNLQKKELIRIDKIAKLQDKVLAQIDKRLEHHADEFDNKDLITYFKILRENADRQDSVNIDALPKIQFNQQVNVSVQNTEPTLNRESRLKVANVIEQILAGDTNLDSINFTSEEINDQS